jgi:hypothetical protein
MHWHVTDTDNPQHPIEETIRGSTNEQRVAFRENGFIAFAEGIQAGQLYLVPERPRMMNQLAVEDLAGVITRTIYLYASKFMSKQEMPPEYHVAVVCHRHELRFATYVPTLNHYGFPRILAMTGDSPHVLPWSHETTVAHLRS